MKILIVGAGASGVTGAINYKRNHPSDDVLIIEHLDAPLKKLLATGNGKCNLGNTNLDINRYSNHQFVEDILKEYNYEDFFDSISIKTKLIDNLAYPYSETATSVKDALLNEAKRLDIRINLNEKLIEYKVKQNSIDVITDKTIYNVDKLFIATALFSFKNLGSDGSILKILKEHNYKIKNPLPGLVPIKTKEDTKILDGLRNKCEVSLLENNKLIHKEKGEVLFKKNGLSGIVIFNLASLIARSEKKANKIVIDLLPELTKSDIEKYCKIHSFDGFLQGFFNPKLIQYLKNRFKKEDDIINATKGLEFTFLDFYDFEFSQVSVGGIELSQINKSLESKIEKNVHFLGEVLDVDGPCGGYNLTFAFASALKATK